jgi:hypothetical protein
MEGYKMTMGRKLHTFSKARPSRMQELKVFKYSGGSTCEDMGEDAGCNTDKHTTRMVK